MARGLLSRPLALAAFTRDPAPLRRVLGNQLAVLQRNVDCLQTQQTKLEKAFLGHHHNFTVYQQHQEFGIASILHCPGIGKPCVAIDNNSSITVAVPQSYVPPPSPFTTQMSGPVTPNGN